MLDYFLFAVVAILGAIVMWQGKRIKELEHVIGSRSSKYGKTVEQLIPISGKFPFNPGNFRFIGSPVDGIQFEDDRIIIIEFKSGKSRLSKVQRRIKHLVEAGKVEFMELRA